ncbi:MULTISPECIES: GNAT family N-acetyltransferase [Streptomyces]|uniref:GNAT family N-acetyltransferase n=1 Tax=Streptomyces TaxID=1883 RepID=UPI001C8B8C62|nr:GNAT family N-acetyltransferase [Streptomyces lateritius]MBX9423833.1 GNAT family N-acetyltransferase [Streptomyces lateritius]
MSTPPSTSLRLEQVTPANVDAALALRVHPHQEHNVAPVVRSLAQAYAFGEAAWPRLVFDGDELVGFLMAFLDIPWDEEKGTGERRSGLWRLNISADAQGKGYGRFAVDAVRDELRRRGTARLYVTWEPGENGPGAFYRRLGFRTTGEVSGGQTVGVLDI